MIQNVEKTKKIQLNFIRFSEDYTQFYTCTSLGFKIHNLDPFEEIFHFESNTALQCVDVSIEGGCFGYVELNNRFFVNLIFLDENGMSDFSSLDKLQIKEIECKFPIENFKLTKDYVLIFSEKRLIIVPFKKPQERMNFELYNTQFSYGGNRVACCFSQKQVVVIDLNLLEEDEELSKTQFDTDSDNCTFSLSPDGSLIAVSEHSGTSFKLYDSKTQKNLRTFGRGYFQSNISCISFTQDNSLMQVTSENGTIHIFLLANRFENQEMIVRNAKNTRYRLGWFSGIWEKWGEELAYEKIERKITTMVNNKKISNICAFSQRILTDVEKKFHTRYVVVLNSIGEYKRFSFRICEDSEMKHVALCKSINNYYNKQKPKFFFSIKVEKRAKRRIKLLENENFVQTDEDDDISIEEIINSEFEEPYGIIDFGEGFVKYTLSNSVEKPVEIPSAVKGDQVGLRILKYDVKRIIPIGFVFEGANCFPVRMKTLLDHVLNVLGNPKRVVFIFSNYLISNNDFLTKGFGNFMKINFPNVAYQTVNQGVAVMRGLNKKSGCFVNIGFNHISGACILNNKIIKDSCLFENLGGNTITNNFKEILQHKYPELAREASNMRFILKNLDPVKIKNAEVDEEEDDIKKVIIDLGGENYFFTKQELNHGLNEIVKVVTEMINKLLKEVKTKKEKIKENLIVSGGTALINGMKKAIEKGLKKKGINAEIIITGPESPCIGVKGSI